MSNPKDLWQNFIMKIDHTPKQIPSYLFREKELARYPKYFPDFSVEWQGMLILEFHRMFLQGKQVGVQFIFCDHELSGLCLELADLRIAIMTGSTFNNSNAGHVKLSHADLRNTNLENSDFTGADISSTDFTGSRMMETNLKDANAKSAKFSGCYLMRAKFRGANLEKADLCNAFLIGADLSETNLKEAKYNHQTVWPEDFDPTNAGALFCIEKDDLQEILALHGKFLSGLQEGRLAKFDHTLLENINLDDVNLKQAIFTGSHIKTSQLKGIDLSEATFERSNCTIVTLDNANLNHANFKGVRFRHVDMVSADLRYADFENTTLEYCCFQKADLSDANLSNTDIQRADFLDANLMRTNLTSAKYGIHTRWPNGFDPKSHGAIFVEDEPQTSK